MANRSILATGILAIVCTLALNLAAPGAARAQATPTAITSAANLPVWKMITLGTHPSVNGLLEDLDSLHCGRDDPKASERTPVIPGTTIPMPCVLGNSAGEIIGRPAFTLRRAKVNVDLVLVSAAQLGFTDDQAAVADIVARARQLGLELCPPEIGPQLRLQYLDQPVGDFVRIAMEPIETYGGVLVDFTVANGGASLLLLGGYAQAETVVNATVRFVFVRPTRTVRRIAP